MSSPDAPSLLSNARETGNPIIDGNSVTFLWEGETAPLLIGDFNHWGNTPAGASQLSQIAPGVWAVSIELPSDAYVEYVFSNEPDDEDERLLDPLNRVQVNNGIGGVNNAFAMPEREVTLLTEFMSNTPQGEITRHSIYHPWFTADERRDVWLYHPPTSEPVPLLVVFDGRDYLRRANLTQIIANLIAVQQMRPVALALMHNAGTHRYTEYNASDTVLAQITELVMPLAYNNLNLIDPDINPGAWGVMGASMGAQMALYAGLRLPNLFGTVIAQAGAYQTDTTDHPSLTSLLLKALPTAPIRIWQDVGTLDALLETNRHMNQLLRERGYDVTYRESNVGHNYTGWRESLPRALTTMFPA
jgi:enterochelin esterase family protein